MSCVWHIHVSLRECVLKRSAIEKGDTENVLVLVTSKRGKYMKISEKTEGRQKTVWQLP